MWSGIKIQRLGFLSTLYLELESTVGAIKKILYRTVFLTYLQVRLKYRVQKDGVLLPGKRTQQDVVTVLPLKGTLRI